MAEFDKKSFAARVKGLAHEYGSEAKLAAASKFTQQTINQWAKGRREPKIDTVKKMCGPIYINPIWLLYGTGPKYESEAEDTSSSGIKWKDASERLRGIIAKWGGVNRTAELAGINKNVLTRWSDGEMTDEDLGKPDLHKFAESTGVNWQWLLHGEGSTLKSDVAKEVAAQEWVRAESFKSWVLSHLSKQPRVEPEDTDEIIHLTAQFSFWVELGDLSHDYQPDIPAGEWAEIIGSSLEEIESLISDFPPKERVKEWVAKIDALNETEKAPDPPLNTEHLLAKVEDIETARELKERNAPQDHQSIFAEIPKWNVKLAAGGGYVADIEEIEERYAFRREWLHKKTSSKDSLVMHDITGDSMEPVFSDGDVCLVDRGERQIMSGSYYALRLGDTVHIKKLQRVKGKIKIVSLNKSYKSIVINPKEDTNNFEVLGKVLWVGKEF